VLGGGPDKDRDMRDPSCAAGPAMMNGGGNPMNGTGFASGMNGGMNPMQAARAPALLVELQVLGARFSAAAWRNLFSKKAGAKGAAAGKMVSPLPATSAWGPAQAGASPTTRQSRLPALTRGAHG
jgi:hypothetical protein